MLATLRPDQAERLETLRAYDVLDTPAEAEFDDIVDLAARICDMPVSLISLVDADRQWFKARTGLDVAETGLEESICSHAILQDGIFEIADASLDPRTVDNPLCIGENPIRFYAGAPLQAPNGLPMGTLCVLDRQPRQLTELQRETLRVLARQVMIQLDLRRALRERAALQHEMDHRVKNSLQTVSSMVRLYSRDVSDESARAVLDAVQLRIDSVGALHEELQAATDGTTVDSASYLSRICALLQNTAPDGVSVAVEAGKFALSAQRATALGMIVSEFAANSIKHGFPEGYAGTITVTLNPSGSDSCQLVCRDDGIGSAGAPDAERADGLGNGLIDAAAAQLEGTLIRRIDESGSLLTVRFPAAV